MTDVFIPGVSAQKSEPVSIDRAVAAPGRAGSGCSMFASDPSARKPPNV
ncbi:MAG: hypothetical protein ABI196_17960 [Bradyrhizobium sp.]